MLKIEKIEVIDSILDRSQGHLHLTIEGLKELEDNFGMTCAISNLRDVLKAQRQALALLGELK